jgi:GTPase SAR1 family protein
MKIYYDDTTFDYSKFEFESVAEKYIKVVVVNKTDLYSFDLFIDKLLKSSAHDVKITENFSDLTAENVSDDIVEKSEDTVSLLENYVNELDISLDKTRLSGMMKSLYLEASELEL